MKNAHAGTIPMAALPLQPPLLPQRISRGARGDTAGGPRPVLARGRLDADPKVLPLGGVDGEEWCGGANCWTRRVALRVLSVPSALSA